MAKARRRSLDRYQRLAIRLVNQLKLALPNQVLKYLYDLACGRRAGALKIPARGANLIERPEQIIR